jgi:hypothetical protein
MTNLPIRRRNAIDELEIGVSSNSRAFLAGQLHTATADAWHRCPPTSVGASRRLDRGLLFKVVAVGVLAVAPSRPKESKRDDFEDSELNPWIPGIPYEVVERSQ